MTNNLSARVLAKLKKSWDKRSFNRVAEGGATHRAFASKRSLVK